MPEVEKARIDDQDFGESNMELRCFIHSRIYVMARGGGSYGDNAWQQPSSKFVHLNAS